MAIDQTGPAEARQPYDSPALKRYGTVKDITKGSGTGSTEQGGSVQPVK
jgi:hypothetical protein